MAVLGDAVASGGVAEVGRVFDFAASYPNSNSIRNRASPFQPSAMLPSSMDYYYYQGSTLTPLCTQNVEWAILANRIKV